jgi:pSer/pThr/pTyr-binding forkhead associated (FHA) protein
LDLFLQACGTVSSLRLEVKDWGDEPAERWIFPQPYVVIGRDGGADLPLNHPQVSRRHAYLQVVGGQIFCVDLASRTGTHWETGPKRAGWMDSEQPIRIGPFQIRPCESGTAPTPARMPLPGVDLEVWDGIAERAQWRMERVLALVGSSSACNLQLANPEVPRFLCSLLRTPTGTWAIDLEGNGVSINGTRVRYAKIDDGDELRVGSYTIRFRRCAPSLPYSRDEDLTTENSRALEAPASNGSAPLRRREMNTPRYTVDRIVPASTPIVEAGGWPATISLPQTETAVADTFLTHFREYLGQIQDQMSDQFSQSMMMMAQTFGALFREQMDLVRNELDQIRQLTRELETLRARLQAETVPSAPALENAHERPPLSPTAPGNTTRPKATAATKATAESKPPLRPPAQEPAKSDESLDDVHALLCQRIAAIQDERQSRWQRILDTVRGRSRV